MHGSGDSTLNSHLSRSRHGQPCQGRNLQMSRVYEVLSSTPKEHHRRIVVRDDRGESSTLQLHRFAQLGKGDRVCLDPSSSRNIFVLSAEGQSELIRVSPVFEQTGEIRVGAQKIPYRISEVATAADLQSLQYLEQFHYKTAALTDPESDEPATAATSGGRKAILLLQFKVGNGWSAAAYVDIQMPLLMVKPRHELFAASYSHPDRPIAWTNWDQQAMRENVNLIARIARIVVSPEYRGLGLARVLLESSKEFAKKRWHIGGRRPIFLEIMAEMLHYIDFVSSSGFVRVGNTEGNVKRVSRDLLSMKKGYDVNSGIMSLQKKYLTHLQEFCKSQARDFEEVVARLEQVLLQDDPSSNLSPEEWLAFRKVIRFPIPYFLCPLDSYSEQYLSQNAAPTTRPRRYRFKVNAPPVAVTGIRVSSDLQISQSKPVRLIMDCFGLSAERIQQRIVGPIDLKASAGNIVFISGSSGSGKSLLLRALDPQAPDRTHHLRTERTLARSYSAGWLKALPSDVCIFEYFAEKYSVSRALTALSQVGLSEATAFIRPFEMLSKGQQYRAMLADLLLRDDEVWLLDEFCADLDPLTARVVAHNFRRHVMSAGRIAIVAAANHGHYLDALRPSRIIALRAGDAPRLVTYKEYRDEFLAQAC